MNDRLFDKEKFSISEIEPLTIDISIRTHDKREIHVQKEKRYCGTDKLTLIKKCMSSLVKTADSSRHKITFFWHDDNSSQECVESLHEIFGSSRHPYHYIALEENGWNYSALKQFEKGRDSKADLVYFVEDDYLHVDTAIDEMVESYVNFKNNLGGDVSIHPFDDPDNYKPRWIEPCRIVYGSKRRWRTNAYSTFTFMCSPEVVRKNWSTFYTMATEYGTLWGEMNNVHEGTMINRIWRTDVTLFTPIPSVALHMQYAEQMDPYIDWKSLWDSI
jgi:hypothetical protein